MSDQELSVAPESAQEVVDLVKSNSSLIPRGGGSKPTLWATRDSTTVVNIRKLSGIVEYLPSEYTITVKSGTLLQELISSLKENGQYLPFDPPLSYQGATIGGTVAAGLSGPGAYRYGPLKDFIIGVRFVDGAGNQVRGGGKVVKNAAGFDFPKLFNGSLGRLGILTELSFKVFPEPKSYVTLSTQLASFDEACGIFPKLKGFDLEGVELDQTLHLYLRLGYQESTMETRKAGLESLVGKAFDLNIGDKEPQIWQDFKSFRWMDQEDYLFKTVTHPSSALKLLESIDNDRLKIHLSIGGKTIYFAANNSSDSQYLDNKLSEHELPGLQIKGEAVSHPLIGRQVSLPFIERIQKALDPAGVFQSFQTEP